MSRMPFDVGRRTRTPLSSCHLLKRHVPCSWTVRSPPRTSPFVANTSLRSREQKQNLHKRRGRRCHDAFCTLCRLPPPFDESVDRAKEYLRTLSKRNLRFVHEVAHESVLPIIKEETENRYRIRRNTQKYVIRIPYCRRTYELPNGRHSSRMPF
jgi:hypothetical protein